MESQWPQRTSVISLCLKTLCLFLLRWPKAAGEQGLPLLFLNGLGSISLNWTLVNSYLWTHPLNPAFGVSYSHVICHDLRIEVSTWWQISHIDTKYLAYSNIRHALNTWPIQILLYYLPHVLLKRSKMLTVLLSSPSPVALPVSFPLK